MQNGKIYARKGEMKIIRRKKANLMCRLGDLFKKNTTLV